MRFRLSAIALLIFYSAAQAQNYAPPPGPTTPSSQQLVPGQITNAPYATGLDLESREKAARDGRYFVFTTGNGGNSTTGGISVPSQNYLNVVACNTSTTKNVYVTLRIFDTNSTASMVYGGVPSPAPLSGNQVVTTAAVTTTGTNVIAGGAASSVLSMSFGVGTSPVNNAAGNAVPSGVGYIYTNTKNELNEIRIIPAGKCFGQYMYNINTGVGAAAVQFQYRMYEYEE